MVDIDNIIKEVSKELNIDEAVVNTVCKHPFKQTVEIMKGDDTKDILFNQLFKFKLKTRFKINKKQKYR